ncbi:MAG: flavin reductase family protein [Bullifex sp.]|nr:flavin reductase [Spirochaetales bacterium]MDY2815384.1 flavin reductase family protein [Bullifex sp.]MDD7536347.1 flavin reductase [Spirochaetales bacterium]MDY3849729.1 flavin reductase family protein [Bullifex sp.]MDY5776867.1 flavin reductase family protein [Bullifex sp.]
MKEVSIQELQINPYTMFSKDWMTLTAGNDSSGFNTMTVSWGHIGSIWDGGNGKHNMPTVLCYVRPSRYTKVFMDSEEYFTLSHFPEEYRKALNYLGSHSGRSENKVQTAGLTPVFYENTTYFAEADLVFVCRKLYVQEMTEAGFQDRDLITRNYPRKDFHTLYIGEIVKVLMAE